VELSFQALPDTASGAVERRGAPLKLVVLGNSYSVAGDVYTRFSFQELLQEFVAFGLPIVTGSVAP
jgi:hypothetical protein